MSNEIRLFTKLYITYIALLIKLQQQDTEIRIIMFLKYIHI